MDAARSLDPDRADEPTAVDADVLRRAGALFAGIEPWRGYAPVGRPRNFLGAVAPYEAGPPEEQDFEEIERRRADLPDGRFGEALFEFYSLVAAVRSARDRFTMVSLGAHYGGPLVNAAFALRRLNPLPSRLIGVEGDRHMVRMLERHFRDNGLDPAEHTVINALVSDTNAPLLFPTTAVRTGSNMALHNPRQRELLFEEVKRKGGCETLLRNLLVDQRTRLQIAFSDSAGVVGELEMVSAVTLGDVLGPLDRVDYLEIDIQSSEYFALPPAIGLMGRKVRWVHLGTHGAPIHLHMRSMFARAGWRLHADLLPQTRYTTPDGDFATQDGVLVAENPGFAPMRPV